MSDIIIDQQAEQIIDQVFIQLALIFPGWKTNWKSDNPENQHEMIDAVKMQWLKGFVENGVNSFEQIERGFKKARQIESDFLPSCGKFIGWCKPTHDELGIPSQSEALKLCFRYHNSTKFLHPLIIDVSPFIKALSKTLDWWLLDYKGTKEVQAHFKEKYEAFIKHHGQHKLLDS